MLVFIVVLIIAAAILETLSLGDPLKFVRFDVSSSKRSVDPNEEFFVVSTIENTRRIPISFIHVSERLPEHIKLDLSSAASQYDELVDDRITHLRSRIYLMPKQRLTRRVGAKIEKRGRYFFRGAQLAAGDFLGFSQTTRGFETLSEIVVLPKRADDTGVLRPLGSFLGEVSVRRFIMEDPVLMLGLNEYTGQEPQKLIAWKQSARLGKLMVKRFDHTLEPSVTVLLCVDAEGSDESEQLIEKCFSIARTVCETLEEKRIKYGFITNASAAGALGIWSSVADGLGENHLLTILEGLGRATYEPREPFSRTVERAILCAEHGRSHILIIPQKSDDSVSFGMRLSRVTGGETLTLYAGEEM